MIFFYCKYNLNTPTEAHCYNKLCLPWHALASLAKLKNKNKSNGSKKMEVKLFN